MDLTTPKFYSGGIGKVDDFNYGSTSLVDNLSALLKGIVDSDVDCIISGGIAKQRSTPSMNIDVSGILAYSVYSENLLYSDSDMGPIAISNGGSLDRIDTIEIIQLATDYDAKTRAFKDPATGVISYSSINTKTRYEIDVNVVQGTEGATPSAPAKTLGSIKIAEVYVSAGESTSILTADIRNCIANFEGNTNSNWTTETGVTFNLNGVSNMKTQFRVKHEESGDHSADAINETHIDWGIGANQVDADLLPLGTGVTSSPTGGTATSLLNSSMVRAAIAEIFNRLLDLSGVQDGAVLARHIANDIVNSQHYAADSIDEEHINWGSSSTQVNAGDVPIIDADNDYTSGNVDGALAEVGDHMNNQTIHTFLMVSTSYPAGGADGHVWFVREA